MNDQKVKTILDQANDLIKLAQEELFKPEEDVVHYLVCRNAFKAVDKYLSGFLLDHGINIHSSTSLETLLTNCREIDSKFNYLNLEAMYSSGEDEDVWMDMGTTQEFLTLAQRIKKMVIQE